MMRLYLKCALVPAVDIAAGVLAGIMMGVGILSIDATITIAKAAIGPRTNHGKFLLHFAFGWLRRLALQPSKTRPPAWLHTSEVRRLEQIPVD